MPALVIAKANYGDEFDVECFRLWESVEKWEDYRKKCISAIDLSLQKEKEKCLQRGRDPKYVNFEVYFGTNEALQFDNGKDWASCFKVVPCSDEVANFIRKTFHGGQFGSGDDIFSISENFGEEYDEIFGYE